MVGARALRGRFARHVRNRHRRLLDAVPKILDRGESDGAAWTALTQAAGLRVFAVTQEDGDAALETARDRYEAALAPVEEISMEITAAMVVIEKRIDELNRSSRRESGAP